jgi:hypothetical protein
MVNQRFIEWIERNVAKDIMFTPEDRAWLELTRDHIATAIGLSRAGSNNIPGLSRIPVETTLPGR